MWQLPDHVLNITVISEAVKGIKVECPFELMAIWLWVLDKEMWVVFFNFFAFLDILLKLQQVM